MSRFRKQLTIGELLNWLNKVPKDSLVFCAPSEVNVDEPVETQEFIIDEDRLPCVTVEFVKESGVNLITFGHSQD